MLVGGTALHPNKVDEGVIEVTAVNRALRDDLDSAPHTACPMSFLQNGRFNHEVEGDSPADIIQTARIAW